jgi:phosphoenolpyruvate carboxylase
MSRTPEYDDKTLRANIRLLKVMLDKVLKHQASPRVAAIVEQLQRQFSALQRDGNPARRQQLLKTLEDLPAETLSEVIRAFSLYFSLLNIAEESTQLQHRRRQIEKNKHYWRGSFHDTLLAFKQSGVTAEQLQPMLDDLHYLPVMTAHPTEAKRRTVRGALRSVFISHEKLQNTGIKGYFREEVLDRLQNKIQLLWKTDEVRAHSMGVIDEIDSGMFYFPLSLFEATAQVYRNLQRALVDVYGSSAAAQVHIPSFLNFGSWIGGDRDGNPNVKPQTTALALRLQARTITQEYLRRIDLLREQLAYSHGLCQPTEAFFAKSGK